MLYSKVKFFVFVLFCTVMISGAATKTWAQAAQSNNSAQSAPSSNDAGAQTKSQIPPALIARWQKSADQGDANSQFLLGNAYYEGNGVAQDLNTAVELWHKSAAQGNANAQRALDKVMPK